MRLYLLRHGHAPSAADAGVATDSERPISPAGEAASRRAAEDLQARGGRPSLILHSPLKRAVQTAEAAARAFKPRPTLEAFEPLSNVLPPEALLEKLRERFASSAEILAVGHQPQIGELAMLLSGQIFDFRPAGLLALELKEKRTAVLWSFSPQDLSAR